MAAAPAPAVTAPATVKASTTMGASAAMKAFATIVPSTPVAHAAVRAAVAGMVRPVVGTVIEVVVVVSFMTLPITKVTPVTVLSTFKVTIVSIKIVMEVPKEAKRSKTNEEGRIETPAERAVEDSVSWNVGVTAEIRIPIPTGAVPATHRIGLRAIDVGFRSIR